MTLRSARERFCEIPLPASYSLLDNGESLSDLTLLF